MALIQPFNQRSVQTGSAIGNQWLSAADSSQQFVSYNPATQDVLGKVYCADAQQLDQALNAAQQAYQKWFMVPAPRHGQCIRLIGEKLRQHKDMLGTLVSIEMGKSKQEGDGEVQEMIDMADFALGQSRMLYGQTMHSERPQHRLYEQWHPLGVVGVITAFNFPVAVWAWNAFIAIICGNSVIWKPSPKTPLCAIAIHQICAEVITQQNYPAIFSLIQSDKTELSIQLTNDDRVNLVSFTGSTQVGQQVGQQVAKRFGKCLLELSGNNAAIIQPSADLDQAIPGIVFSAVGTAGQRCTTLRRLFIHQSLYTEVTQRLKTVYQQLKIGDPTDANNHVGPVIDQQAVDQYKTAIEQAKQAGGNVIVGGKILDREGFFVTPTIIEAQPDWPIVKQETFGPILYVMRHTSLSQAIHGNNQSNHGLSSALFSQNMREIEQFLSAAGSDCGIANINIGTSGAEIGGAFGGEKHTGGGREAGSDAWKAYMRRQTNTLNWGTELPLAQGIKFTLNR